MRCGYEKVYYLFVIFCCLSFLFEVAFPPFFVLNDVLCLYSYSFGLLITTLE